MTQPSKDMSGMIYYHQPVRFALLLIIACASSFADTTSTLPFATSGVTWNGGFGDPSGATIETSPGSYTVGTGGNSRVGRPILKFDLSTWAANLPAGETLQNATLRIYHRLRQGNAAPATVFHSVADNFPALAPEQFQDSSYAASSGNWTNSVSDGVWLEFDVTTQVLADMASDGSAIRSSFRLQQDNDLALTTASIRYLIDRAEGNPARPPELVLTTTGPFVPPVPDLFTTSVQSPDGSILVEIIQANLHGTANYPDQPALYYRVLKQGNEVIEWSPLGLTRADSNFTGNFSLVEEIDEPIHEIYPLLHGKTAVASNLAAQKTIRLINSTLQPFEVIFRAYNDGIAFRYFMPGSGSTAVTQEISGYRIPAASRLWLHPRGNTPSNDDVAYERLPSASQIETTTNGRWGNMLLAETPAPATYLLLHESDLDETYAASHLSGPSNRLFTLTFPNFNEGNNTGNRLPTASLPWTTPWRAAIIGSLDQITRSTLTTDLARPFDPASQPDLSWIKPGKSAWSWLTQGTGSIALQTQYIDSAAEFGWEHVLIDANWHNFSGGEAAMQNLVAYAVSKNIGIHLWYNSGGPIGTHTSNASNGPVDRMLDPTTRRAEMDKIASWGVAGIKVDYLNGGKQDRIAQYLDIIQDALARRLMVNFHGSTLPVGWRRTYPNFMTTEAVRGAEQYKFVSGTAPDGLANVRFAFLRNPIGPMDYTPITFELALNQKNLTYAHQLSMAVVYESGIQHFGDRADANQSSGFRAVFNQAPFVQTFLNEVPAHWDETRLVSGHPDSHIIIARRKDDVWHLGGMEGAGNTVPYALSAMDFTPLPCQWNLIRGNGNTGFTQEISTQSILSSTMQARSGFVAQLSPIETPYYLFIKPLVADFNLLGPLADADADGLSNVIEYQLGTDPASAANATDLLPTILFEDGTFTLRHGQRPGAIVTSIDYQTSTDLSPGSWVTLSNPVITTDSQDRKLVSLPQTEERLFIRIAIHP